MENSGLALTNLFLGLCCLLYAKYSWQVPTPIPLLKNNVTWLYLSISLVCVLNFLIFGFYNLPDGVIHNFIEQTALLTTSLIFFFILSIVLTLQMPSKPRKARALLLIPTFVYALLTFQWSTFTYVNLILIPIIGSLCYLMINMYHLNKNKQVLLGILSLALLYFMVAFQNYFVNISNPIFFFIYIPITLVASAGLYQGMALFLNQSNKSGLFNVVANNNTNYLTSSSLFQVNFPKTAEDVQLFFNESKKISKIVSIQSSGYSIGGQHLIENGILINSKKMNKVEFFDSVNGLVKTGPSMTWHQLLSYLNKAQKDNFYAWVPKQIPTHFLDYSIGGAVSANTHGNNLYCLPLIKDIESIDLIDFSGEIKRIHRKANNELFKLVIGGYGLFGFIAGIELRLSRKMILKRKVESIFIKDLPNEIIKHHQAGCLNFELMLNTDETKSDFLQKGIISSYFPIEADPKTIQFEAYHHSYFDKNTYKDNLSLFINNKNDKLTLKNDFLMSKNELYYCSNQITPYCPLEKNLKLANLFFPEYRDYDLIEQQYFIPISQINAFLNKLSSHKVCREFNLLQARISVTKKDDESFLYWSSQDFIALELSFHIPQSAQSIIHIKEYLTELTEEAIHHEGSFDLGYLQCYEKGHLLKCYPLISDFLNLKLKHDPSEIIQNNWYQDIKKIIYGSKTKMQAFSGPKTQIQTRS